MRASNQLLLGIKKLTLLRNHKVSFSLPGISIRHLPLRRAIARKPQYGEVHIYHVPRIIQCLQLPRIIQSEEQLTLKNSLFLKDKQIMLLEK